MKQCSDCRNFFIDCVGVCGGVYGSCIYDPIRYEGLGNREGKTPACSLFKEVSPYDGSRSHNDSLHAAY